MGEEKDMVQERLDGIRDELDRVDELVNN